MTSSRLRFCPILPVAVVALAALGTSACNDAGCLKSDDPACRVASPCQKLAYACNAGSLELRTLDGVTPPPGGEAALGRNGDVLLGNDRITMVVAALGNQNFIELSGGSILDLQPRGGNADALNQIITAVGVLPRDSAYYTSLQLIDERPTRVGIQLRGTLFEQPDTLITTLYEVRPCEPGVRVRSVVYNGTPDPQTWTLSDGWYWSGREPIPFTAAKGHGFVHMPLLDVAQLDDAFESSSYLAASSHVAPDIAYAEVGCTEKKLDGFHGEQLSSFGTPRAVILPRGIVTFERFIMTAARGDAAAGIDLALEARQKLFSESYVTLSGSVQVTPAPLGLTGTTARSDQYSLLVYEGDAKMPVAQRTPITQIVPRSDGSFNARVPTGRRYVIELEAFGRKVGEQDLGKVDGDLAIAAMSVPRTSVVKLTVVDALAAPLDAEVFVVPADDPTASSVAGSFHAQFGVCAPWLGPPPGASPACNRFLNWHALGRPVEVEIPNGRYWLYACHGPFFTIARQLVELTGATQAVELQLRDLALQPQGTLTGDFHIHGAASFDSAIPDWDRVLSFSAANLDVAIATDHDVVYDYADMAKQLGLSDHLSTVTGIETTGHMPWFYIPKYDYPLVIGHYNMWPLRYAPGEPRNGGPFDELIEPGTLFDRTEPLFTGTSIIELNHPWLEPIAARDQGFPKALSLSALRDLPDHDDGTAAGMFVRAPGGGHTNDSHHAQEVMNGSQNDTLIQYRWFWFYMLNQGKPKTGTANSDSHSLTDTNVGTPRNVVFTDTVAGPAFDIDRFDDAVRKGRSFGTNGPVIEAAIIDAPNGGPEVELPYGMGLLAPSASARLRISVSAAPWVPVDELRIFVNAVEVKHLGASSFTTPVDPFGTVGLARLTTELPLAELLVGVPAGVDAWIVIETGTALPLSADLGGGLDNEKDGIPDTGDNNGDGVVDARDVTSTKGYGPLAVPPAPVASAPLFHFYQVTNGYPFAFTNPFLLDRNGNGRFDRIGVLP